MAASAQLYPSSCTAPDSIKQQYRTDAQRLALRRVYKLHLPEMSMDTIPTLQADTMMNALITLYNATTMPQRDTIFSILNIHSFANGGVDSPYKFTLNKLQIWADETEPWMMDFKNNIIPTSNTTINQFLTDYHLTLDTYLDLTSGLDGLFFTSDSNFNMHAVAATWGQSFTVIGNDPGMQGDAPDILNDTVTDTYTRLTFRYGWEDCPSGCVYNRYWTFRVNFDCTVQFDSAYGDVLPPLLVPGIARNTVQVYPNPFAGSFSVSQVPVQTPYQVYSITGTIVNSGLISGSGTIAVEGAPGIYFLKLAGKEGTQVIKLLKE